MCSKKSTEPQEELSGHQHLYFMSQAWPIPSPLPWRKFSLPSSLSSFSANNSVSHFIQKIEATRREVSQASTMPTRPLHPHPHCPLPTVPWMHHHPHEASLALMSQASSPSRCSCIVPRLTRLSSVPSLLEHSHRHHSCLDTSPDHRASRAVVDPTLAQCGRAQRS